MRIADRAILVAVLLVAAVGCAQLDGRSRNRKGNQAFRETRFVDAVAQYQIALSEVDDPIIHYNLALTYSKIFKIGAVGDVLIDLAGEPACTAVPKTKTIDKQVCIKAGDKHYLECDDKNPCAAASYRCEKSKLCALDNNELADLAAQHFGAWLKSHPEDAESRALMTQVWLDSSQYKKAIEYWEELGKQKPNSPEIMGNLAGISLKAGDWRTSIEWYLKVADVSAEPSAKVAAYQFIGNVAWSKLNSKTLTRPESVELANRGIGALQKASALLPENPKPYGLMVSIFNFRAQAHGASWAGALDRATAQDFLHTSRVLYEKARKAAGQAPAPVPGAATNTPNPGSPKSGG